MLHWSIRPVLLLLQSGSYPWTISIGGVEMVIGSIYNMLWCFLLTAAGCDKRKWDPGDGRELLGASQGTIKKSPRCLLEATRKLVLAALLHAVLSRHHESASQILYLNLLWLLKIWIAALMRTDGSSVFAVYSRTSCKRRMPGLFYPPSSRFKAEYSASAPLCFKYL